MKDKLIKVKRKSVNWYQALLDLQNPEIEAEYHAFRCAHKKYNNRLRLFVFPSKNRSAYNVLKKHYSTTALLRYRYTGEFQ